MTGVLSMGGGAWGAMTAPLDQSTLSQPGGGGGADYARRIISTGTPGFSDLPTALNESSSSRMLQMNDVSNVMKKN